MGPGPSVYQMERVVLELGIVLVGGLIPAIIKPQFKAKTKPAFLCGLYMSDKRSNQPVVLLLDKGRPLMMSLAAFAVDTNSGVRGISICAFSMSLSFMFTCPFFMGVYWTVSGRKVPPPGRYPLSGRKSRKGIFAD